MSSLADELVHLGTATLTWHLNRNGIWRSWMRGVRPLTPGMAFAGPAFTVSFVPAREDLATAESYKGPDALREAWEQVAPGQVVVCDGRGDQSMGIIGDMYATRLMVRGAAAFVTDTPVRDAKGIAALNWPLFCSGGAAPASIHGLHYTDHGRVIGCGGVAVVPGDWIVGDDDGVVVVPQALAAQVAQEAADTPLREAYTQARLKAGDRLTGLYPPSDETLAAFQTWKARR